jgi:hypothetical protein
MKNFDDLGYTNVVNVKDGSEYFETYGDDLEFVHKADPDHVWTVVDVDGNLIVVPGFHYVDRFLYIITEEPIKAEHKGGEYLWE